MNHFLKLWGTRGSSAVSGPEYRRFGGNTICLEVRYGDTLLIVDAGTGIRPLGEQLLKEKIRKIHLFLSHTHWDHVMGFPFFDPIYQSGVHLTIWAPQGTGRSCLDLFKEIFAKEFFPVRLEELSATLEFKSIKEKTPQSIGALQIDFHRTEHPGTTVCFKITTPCQTIGYVTDNEVPHEMASCQSLIKFYKNCDLFIHEAQYTPEEYKKKQHWGHSSSANIVSLVQQIQPTEWLVTHHDPKHTDADLDALYEETKKLLQKNNIACPVKWMCDGDEMQLKHL